MRSADYRKAIAQVLTEAASRSLIERWYRVGPHRVLQDAAQLSVACYIVDRMLEPPHYERRLWIAVEPLMPELGRCISELRWMLRVEPRVERGLILLDTLRDRAVRPEETVSVIDALL